MHQNAPLPDKKMKKISGEGHLLSNSLSPRSAPRRFRSF